MLSHGQRIEAHDLRKQSSILIEAQLIPYHLELKEPIYDAIYFNKIL